MSVKVHLVKQRVMAGEHKGEERYYGRLKARDKISFKQLCAKIAKESAPTDGDVELVLKCLIWTIGEHLSLGNIVNLEGLGTMRISVGSRGSDTVKGFHISMMKKARILFHPAKVLKEMLGQVSFSHQDTKTVVVNRTPQPSPEPPEEDD